MIRLLIDGREVALPEDFSFTLYEENPVFTKNGEYTYDLILSLKNFRNAEIYEHIDRINIEKEIQYNRSAVLWVDNKIRLNGTEIILGFTDSEVKIQLASGKSELNFLIGGDNKVRDLDLGTADVNPDTVIDDLSHPYPERNWLILPYIARNFDDYYYNLRFIFNRWELDYGFTPHKLYYQFDGTHDIVSQPDSELRYYKNYRPQPYLCFIIEATLKSLGYTLTYNALADHSVLRYMYIVHGFDTWEFSKMLPDWTVNDFFSKIETQFDCTFIVDGINKEVGLYLKSDNLIDETVTMEIKDEFDVDIDEDNVQSVQSANIGYNIDTSEDTYYLFQKLDKSVKDAVKIGEYITLNDLLTKVGDYTDKYRLRKIFKETLFGGSDVIAGSRYVATNNAGITRPQKVDSFRDFIQDPSREELDITFDLIPAAMQSFSSGNYYFQYPVVHEADPIVKSSDEIEEDFTPIKDLIEGDNSVESVSVSTKMYLALYSGRHKLVNWASSTEAETFPLPYVESLAEFFVDNNTIYYFNDQEINPFRLEWLKENIYNLSSNIDTTEPYIFSFEWNDNFNIRSNFIIRNREFVCLKVEKPVTNDGFGKYALGYFYPKGNKKEA
ncbi:MAG: hypothetical protein ACK5M3_15935 [Dysgonomonas sp.]